MKRREFLAGTAVLSAALEARRADAQQARPAGAGRSE